MSLTNLIQKVVYGSGGTTHSITFKVFDNDEIVVKLRDESVSPITETLQVIGSSNDYTLTGDPATAVVTNSTVPASNKLVIERVIPLEQETDHINAGTFLAEDTETGLDKLAGQNQQQQDGIDRSLKVTTGSAGGSGGASFDPTFLATADKVMAINSAGTGIDLVTLATATTIPGTTKGDVMVHDGTDNVRLAVGTNDQVLAVATDTPAWESLVATKGDLMSFDTTRGILGVGANGLSLVADSTESLGIKWGTPGSVGVRSIVWSEPGGAPVKDIQNGCEVFNFIDGGAQTLQTCIFIPTAYAAGSQALMRLLVFSPSTSGTVLLRATVTLIDTSTDAVTASANTHISLATTPALVTLDATANKLHPVVLDLCEVAGTMETGGGAVGAGDMLKVVLDRDSGTDTDTADTRFVFGATEVTFT